MNLRELEHFVLNALGKIGINSFGQADNGLFKRIARVESDVAALKSNQEEMQKQLAAHAESLKGNLSIPIIASKGARALAWFKRNWLVLTAAFVFALNAAGQPLERALRRYNSRNSVSVYWQKGSGVYHLDKNCPRLHGHTPVLMSLPAARQLTLELCPFEQEKKEAGL